MTPKRDDHSYVYYVLRSLSVLDKALAKAGTREEQERIMWAIEILKGKDDTNK